jgi:hypothetical protein
MYSWIEVIYLYNDFVSLTSIWVAGGDSVDLPDMHVLSSAPGLEGFSSLA